MISAIGSEPGLLLTVPSNVVQSIRAFRVPELQAEAVRLGQHFLYAFCPGAMTKQQVLARIAASFGIPRSQCRTFNALEHCLTDVIRKAGPQPGFLVVLEQMPDAPKFDREARETVLDVFRNAAEFWAERKVPFRVFYSCE